MPGSKSVPPNRPEMVPAPAAFSRSAHQGVFLLPIVRNIRRRSLTLCVFSIFLLFSQFAAFVNGARAQGFGLTKKTVKLQRKMPASVHLPGPGFDVQVNAHDAGERRLGSHAVGPVDERAAEIRQEAAGQGHLARRIDPLHDHDVSDSAACAIHAQRSRAAKGKKRRTAGPVLQGHGHGEYHLPG